MSLDRDCEADNNENQDDDGENDAVGHDPEVDGAICEESWTITSV